nr:hypothetical protein [Tanacetum cinerariifolium]
MGLMRSRLLGSFRSSLRADTCPSMILLEFWFNVPSLREVIDPLGRVSAAFQKSLDAQQACREDNTVSLVPDFTPGPSSGVRATHSRDKQNPPNPGLICMCVVLTKNRCTGEYLMLVGCGTMGCV